MSKTEDLVHRYIETWNERDAGRRRATIDAVYAERCAYTDPLGAVGGREGIDGFIAAVQTQFPGAIFSLAGGVDAHHDVARFTWHARLPGVADPVAIGFDVAVIEEGRIQRVYGFLDKAPG
jgi:hypothetical protein